MIETPRPPLRERIAIVVSIILVGVLGAAAILFTPLI